MMCRTTTPDYFPKTRNRGRNLRSEERPDTRRTMNGCRCRRPLFQPERILISIAACRLVHWQISSFSTEDNTGTISLVAVSYTHLRAHETPEHLVCRLLL